MKEKSRTELLKIISILAVFSFIFAATTVVKAYFFNNINLLLDSVIMFFSMLFGYLSGRMTAKFASKSKKVFFSVAGFLLILITSYAIYKLRLRIANYEIFYLLLQNVILFIIYLLNLKYYYFNYYDILTGKTILIGSMIFILCMYAGMALNGMSNINIYIYVSMYYFIFAVLLVKNQANVDNAFMQTHIEKAKIPGNLRNLNTKIIILLYLIIIAVINLKPIFSVIWDVIKKFIGFLLMLIFTRSEYNNGESAEGMEKYPNLGLAEGSKGGILTKILTLLAIAVVLLLIVFLFKNRSKIFALVYSFMRNIRRRIGEFINNIFKHKPAVNNLEIEYFDEVESIEPEKQKSNNKRKIYLKDYRKMLKRKLDYLEKIRYMYAIIMYLLLENKIEIEKSDTPTEIYIKACKIKNICENFSRFTKIYQNVRYGNLAIQGKEIDIAEKDYRFISQLLEGKS